LLSGECVTMMRFVRCSVALIGFAALTWAGGIADASSRVIRDENAKQGADDWQLTRVRLDKSDGMRSPAIEGYCSKQSVKAGEKLDIFVSTDPPSKFKLEIFRTGYYGGK